MLPDSSVAVMRTRPRAIPLAMITMRKSTHGFPFASHMDIKILTSIVQEVRTTFSQPLTRIERLTVTG